MTDRQANVKLRSYQTSDCMDILALFHQTVHRINEADYTEQQLNVWATGNEDPIKWDRSLSSHYAIVAIVNDQIVGFGDIDQTGYWDRLFVHSDFQRQGIATAICNALEEKSSAGLITTYASLTAVPFFTHRGYAIKQKNLVVRSGVKLTNFLMCKIL